MSDRSHESNGRPEASLSGAAGFPAASEPEDLSACYANFVRVASTPEELVLDFGLNTNVAGTNQGPVRIAQRLVVNYYTAKRLWMTLGAALQRHEQTFGALETDVNKRVIPGLRPSSPR